MNVKVNALVRRAFAIEHGQRRGLRIGIEIPQVPAANVLALAHSGKHMCARRTQLHLRDTRAGTWHADQMLEFAVTAVDTDRVVEATGSKHVALHTRCNARDDAVLALVVVAAASRIDGCHLATRSTRVEYAYRSVVARVEARAIGIESQRVGSGELVHVIQRCVATSNLPCSCIWRASAYTAAHPMPPACIPFR
jgi:hypothetical protein